MDLMLSVVFTQLANGRPFVPCVTKTYMLYTSHKLDIMIDSIAFYFSHQCM